MKTIVAILVAGVIIGLASAFAFVWLIFRAFQEDLEDHKS